MDYRNRAKLEISIIFPHQIRENKAGIIMGIASCCNAITRRRDKISWCNVKRAVIWQKTQTKKLILLVSEVQCSGQFCCIIHCHKIFPKLERKIIPSQVWFLSCTNKQVLMLLWRRRNYCFLKVYVKNPIVLVSYFLIIGKDAEVNTGQTP